jgi:hypothetical protein
MIITRLTLLSKDWMYTWRESVFRISRAFYRVVLSKNPRSLSSTITWLYTVTAPSALQSLLHLRWRRQTREFMSCLPEKGANGFELTLRCCLQKRCHSSVSPVLCCHSHPEKQKNCSEVKKCSKLRNVCSISQNIVTEPAQLQPKNIRLLPWGNFSAYPADTKDELVIISSIRCPLPAKNQILYLRISSQILIKA